MTRLSFRRGLLRLTGVLLGLGALLSSVAVRAAQDAPDLVALPWIQIMLGCWISAWGGAAATLTRYLASVYEDRPFLVKVEVAKDIVVSGLIGSLTYMTGALYQWPALVIGPALLMAGWLGVRLLNVAADKVLAAVAAK